MAYYVPTQEVADVAAYARSLQGMHAFAITTRYARPTIPTAVVMRAAQTAAALQAARDRAAAGGVSGVFMSGRGLGILPTVNVKYAKTAIPAALASREWNRLHPPRSTGVSGLGKIYHAQQVPIVAGVRRQAGFFMGPGGGPGGGPFHFPGYTLSGLSADAAPNSCVYYGADGVTPESVDANSNVSECAANGGTWFPAPIDTTSIAPGTTLTPPSSPNPYAGSSASFVPAAVSQAILQTLKPGTPAGPIAPPAPAFSSSSMLPILGVGLGAIVLIGAMRGRRRNPSRRARRSRRRNRY